ncbi:hypothetical protein MUK42_23754 [Musa troglodytarum]|uniref:Uncharacterized protein n=1 Tax=Musa troglodytarum TaxID=320322 RepID=A0A9E7K961_9LILI|nr:hypothetical protein MUK42_23754 [Musa troglodytarum]
MAVLVVSAATAAEGTRLGKSGRDKRLQVVAAGGVVAEEKDKLGGLLPEQRTAPSGPNGMQSPYVPRAGQIQRLDPAEYHLPEPPPSPQRLD